MKKTPTIFERGRDHKVIPVHNLLADWVFETPWSHLSICRKWDGTCCMIQDGKFYKRRMLRPGYAIPEGWIPVEEIGDDTGGLAGIIGWIPVDPEGDADQWHMEAWEANVGTDMQPGTYELCGPAINGNPDKFSKHILLEHIMAPQIATEFPFDYEGFQAALATVPEWEGFIIRHRDGRMAKIKQKDYPRGN
jgi:hypothetical protein